MSINNTAPLEYRLLEHIAYKYTQDMNETSENPNEGGAENLWLGTLFELPYTFHPLKREKLFNDSDDPIHLPKFVKRNISFVACVQAEKGESNIYSKVYVYGVYKLKGMEDIITTYKNHIIEWFGLEIPDELYAESIEKIKIKNKIFCLPTPNYEQLTEDQKKIKQYHNISVRFVPLPSSKCCAIS